MNPSLKTRKKSIANPTVENVKWIRQIPTVFYTKRSSWNVLSNQGDTFVLISHWMTAMWNVFNSKYKILTKYIFFFFDMFPI